MKKNREKLVEERFWAKVKKTDTCWLWTGANCAGYGLLYEFNRIKRTQAHRYSLKLVGRDPRPDQFVDHLCRVPSCVNPDHLEAVTPKENTHRGLNSFRGGLHEFCFSGKHKLTPDIIVHRLDGRLRCRLCKNEGGKLWMRQKRAKLRLEKRSSPPSGQLAT